MRRVLFIAFSLVILVTTLFGSQEDKDREMEALIDRAKELSDIRAEGATPFRSKMTFKIFKDDGSVAEGTLKEVRLSRAKWRKETVVGNFRRTEVVVGHKIWTLNSASTEPEGLNNIPSVLHPMGWLQSGRKAESLEDSTVNGIVLRCFSLKTSFGKSESCFDKNSGTLALHVSPIPGKLNVDSTYLYADYKKFGDRMLPTSYENREGQKIRSQGSLEEMIFQPEIDHTLFDPLAGVKETAYCFEWMRPPKITHQVSVVRPKKGNQTVTVWATISVDGTPADVRVSKPADADFDRAAIESVRQWRFSAATCHGEPVETDSAVQIVFQ